MADGRDIVEQALCAMRAANDGTFWISAKAARAVAAEIERLRAQAPGWRGMESAPKDGTRIIVFKPHASYTVHVDRWKNGGWWECRPHEQPTHWMPLPRVPEQEGI